jgi:hypothetical protein
MSFLLIDTFHFCFAISPLRCTHSSASNRHFPRQSPQAVQRSGLFTAAHIRPPSPSTIPKTPFEHLLTQRPHPLQRSSTTRINRSFPRARRCKFPTIHSANKIPKQTYTIFIFLKYLKNPLQRLSSTKEDKPNPKIFYGTTKKIERCLHSLRPIDIRRRAFF